MLRARWRLRSRSTRSRGSPATSRLRSIPRSGAAAWALQCLVPSLTGQAGSMPCSRDGSNLITLRAVPARAAAASRRSTRRMRTAWFGSCGRHRRLRWRHRREPVALAPSVLVCASARSNPAILMPLLTPIDAKFLRIAYEEAKAGFDEGGCPIGCVLAEGERVIAQGRNQRVQQGDPIAHGEMDCLRKAGRQRSYRRMTLYTSLSPCMMCTGTVIQFGIPRVVIGEAQNFPGNPDLLRERGVEVIIADDPDCIALMARFIREKPQLWNEDIMEGD